MLCISRFLAGVSIFLISFLNFFLYILLFIEIRFVFFFIFWPCFRGSSSFCIILLANNSLKCSLSFCKIFSDEFSLIPDSFCFPVFSVSLLLSYLFILKGPSRADGAHGKAVCFPPSLLPGRWWAQPCRPTVNCQLTYLTQLLPFN